MVVARILPDRHHNQSTITRCRLQPEQVYRFQGMVAIWVGRRNQRLGDLEEPLFSDDVVRKACNDRLLDELNIVSGRWRKRRWMRVLVDVIGTASILCVRWRMTARLCFSGRARARGLV